MAFKRGRDVQDGICRALGIDPKVTTRLIIDLEANSVSRLRVHQLMVDSQADALTTVIRDYDLVERERSPVLQSGQIWRTRAHFLDRRRIRITSWTENWCGGGRRQRGPGEGRQVILPSGIGCASAEQRRRTPPAFAAWLLEVAARCGALRTREAMA